MVKQARCSQWLKKFTDLFIFVFILMGILCADWCHYCNINLSEHTIKTKTTANLKIIPSCDMCMEETLYAISCTMYAKKNH